MDVTCERCSTAYDFDDALVSERGTTVKCTNCGHQFKVRRAVAQGVPERWVVRTLDGRELEFRALRELQSAIAQALISREDVLTRDGARPRRLGSIAELEPFFASVGFESARGTSPGLGERAPGMFRSVPSSPGAGPTNIPSGTLRYEASVAIPLPRGPQGPDEFDDETVVMTGAIPGAIPSRRVPSVPPPPRRSTPPQARASSRPPPALMTTAALENEPTHVLEGKEQDAVLSDLAETVLRPARVPSVEGSKETTLPVPVDDALPAPARVPPVEVAAAPAAEEKAPEEDEASDVPAESEDETKSKRSEPSSASGPSSSGSGLMTPTPSAVRSSYQAPPSDEHYTEPRFSSRAPVRRAGAARWIVGIVIVGMLALAGATVGRKMLAPSAPAASVKTDDARTARLLDEGEKSLFDGDLESAKEQFDKASALAERDARVVTNLARLSVVRADFDWLKVRMLPEGDPDAATLKREAEQAAERARKATDLAAAIAPSEPGVIRCRIDTLRLAGDLSAARQLVGGITTMSSQPDNALTLAALDLAEDKPDWPTVIDRLRVSQSSDKNLGRARAMLVYALARSGDLASARAELERLESLPRPHPLVRGLRAFIARAGDAKVEAPASSASAEPATSASALAPASVSAPTPTPTQPTAVVPQGARPAEGRVPDDYVAPQGEIDTSDLPGFKPKPKPTSDMPQAPSLPPDVDTSDLPEFNK